MSSLNIGNQAYHVRMYFPQFRLGKRGPKRYLIGTLQPTPSSSVYTVKIEYQGTKPKVFILHPKLLKSAPHVYPDKSLCLYYPKDASYHTGQYLSHTIIPWAAEWLYFYEVWVRTGVWWGREAPHNLNSKRGSKIAGKQ
ncbi:hypothetical protein P9761_05445 [Brevibacillus centrosporus]|uniref:hypothetical protein n=1 Tax=Brevibacillus centrosporus TaxID=54910 RepID=UPI002E1BD0AB|nr:hypothetical protein [Brevibacillus centrosporus]